MASKETERMIKLGEWLENYLNPEIKARDYRALAKEFLRLYDVDFKLEENELTIKFFECLDKQDEETKSFYQKIWEWEDFIRSNDLVGNELDPLMIKSFFRELIFNVQDGKKIGKYMEITPFTVTFDDNSIADSFSKKVAYLVIFLDYEKSQVHELLEIIGCSKEHWQRTLFNIDNGLVKPKVENETLLSESFVNKYCGLGDKLFINEESGLMELRKKFIGPEWYLEIFPENTSVFPWDIAHTRVFFDFLLLGGQNHIHFCKQCGRFTVIKRKGRKEYCSSLCRVRASNERIAQAGA